MSTKIDPWRGITLEELAKHDDVDKSDAWLAVRGIVYDVSSYAAKHPGGESKIRKYAGKDATETFDMVHAYVDPMSILRGLQVGVLKGPNGYKRSCCTRLKHFFGCSEGRQYNKPPHTYFKQDSIVATYVVEFSHESQEFEWTVGITEKRTLHVFKCLGRKKAWLSLYDLPEELKNDQLSITFRKNYKHIHITLRKPIPMLLIPKASTWVKQLHGLKINGKFVQITEGHSKFNAFITYKKCLTPNVLMFGIQVASSCRIGIPIGYHVELHHEGICRPYTPVCFEIMTESPILHSARAREKKQMEDLPITILYFMIKIYPDGAFTKLLDEIEPDDGREFPTLQVSTPHGYFDADEFLHDFSALFLISAGTGITPMTRILQRFWHMSDKLRSKRIVFWHFVQRDYDLIWKKELTELEAAASWFRYFPVLTQADSKWSGLRGRISQDLMSTCVSEMCLEKRGARKACICGPPGFNSTAVSSLAGEVHTENMFVFSN